MGHINQALVQERLVLGAERVPVICLIIACAMGIVVDFDIGVADVITAAVVLCWGLWVLRSCAGYDPRLFHNLSTKYIEASWYWLNQPSKGASRDPRAGRWTRGPRWDRPATPRLMKRIPGEQRQSTWRIWR